MRKLLALVTLLIAGHSVLAQSVGQSTLSLDEAAPKKHVLLRVQPHWLLIGDINLESEIRLSKHFAIGPTLNYMPKGKGIYYGTLVSNSVFFEDKTNRIGVGAKGSYYFRGFDQSSALISLFGRQSLSKTETSSSTGSYVEKGQFKETVVGVSGGYQWIWGVITMNLTGGIANYEHPRTYEVTDNSGNDRTRTLGASGTSYVLDAGLGVAF